MSTLGFDPQAERIQTARQRLAAAYARQPGAEVPVVELEVCTLPHTPQQAFDDMDKMLDNAAAWANALAMTDNDWPPMIQNYCSVVMVPEAFGCEVVFAVDGQQPWARHAIFDIEKVWDLKPVPVGQSPVIKLQFEWTDYAQRKLGTEVPFWTLDIQSPFSVAAQIVEPCALLAACVTHPKEVHHVCKLVTEYWIEFMNKHLAQMEHPGFPGANFPSITENVGICIADDTPLIMLNPEMYREFALPYNSMLGELFGGVHIHCCGDYSHNLDNLLKTANIRSIQVHGGPGEFKLPETASQDHPFNRARQQISYFVDVNDIARGDQYRGKYRELLSEYVIPRLRTGDMAGCILQSCGCQPGSSIDDYKAAIAWTREQLQA